MGKKREWRWCANILRFILLIIAMASAPSNAQQNTTVGNGEGICHTAWLFSPFGWEDIFDSGDLYYEAHVSLDPNTPHMRGQRQVAHSLLWDS